MPTTPQLLGLQLALFAVSLRCNGTSAARADARGEHVISTPLVIRIGPPIGRFRESSALVEVTNVSKAQTDSAAPAFEPHT